MYKRVISIMLVLCLLAFSVPTAFAENQSTPQRTIEEILDEYHAKSFEAQCAEEGIAVAGSGGFGNGTAAICADGSGSGTASLEQETVDALNAAGYEAYHVTASNYACLEDQMKTDFSQLGLDPDCSYIVTVSGEETGAVTPPNSGVGTNGYKPPAYDNLDDGSSSFLYTYNGATYYMRYVIVTASSDSSLRVHTTYSLTKIDNKPNVLGDVLSTCLSMALDKVGEKIPIGTILTLLGGWIPKEDNGNLVTLQADDITIIAETVWTRHYIQIWNPAYSMWHTVQGSEYANSLAYCAGTAYNAKTNRPVPVIGDPQTNTTYSYKYNDLTQRKIDAVQAYLTQSPTYTFTGDLGFYLVKSTGEINFNVTQDPLFVHEESFNLIPRWSET